CPSSSMEPKEKPIDDFPLMPTEKEIAYQPVLKEPKEEPLELFSFEEKIAVQSAVYQKEPKQEPLDLLSFENEVPLQNFMGDKICKKEELDGDAMASSHFDLSAFGPPIDHFPIPLAPKDELIEEEPTMKKSRPESDKSLEKKTPQCIMCEKFPKTACGYVNHLFKHNNSTLKTIGIYLLCSCGIEIRTHYSSLKHNGQCDGSQFSLHKEEE
ncbi:hypothetical protein PENTCL1PPCAC_13259, partial [Pristionchus entomophagus]